MSESEKNRQIVRMSPTLATAADDKNEMVSTQLAIQTRVLESSPTGNEESVCTKTVTRHPSQLKAGGDASINEKSVLRPTIEFATGKPIMI